MTRVVIATALNFFFPGLGWLVFGREALAAVLMLVGVIGLTYVETSLQTAAPELWLPMFASVFLVNTGLAIDCYRWGAARIQR